MRRCSTSLVFSEMQIEITMRLHFIFTRLAKVNKSSLPDICENVEKQDRISYPILVEYKLVPDRMTLHNKLKHAILFYLINRNKEMVEKVVGPWHDL